MISLIYLAFSGDLWWAMMRIVYPVSATPFCGIMDPIKMVLPTTLAKWGLEGFAYL